MRLSVGIVGAGLIGGKRADALGSVDTVVGVHDVDHARASVLADRLRVPADVELDALLEREPDVVVVATTHDALADLACRALEAGSHVLVEKPAGLRAEDIDRIAAAAKRAARLVKVGFNHRFHPGIRRAITEARSGEFGPVMYMRARYGHGGRLGYEQEWRADASISGGGELIDQGMHLIDLSNALHGPLPLHGALVHTDYWDMDVDDNAVVTLGAPGRTAPWTAFHVSCSEWKNLFDLEIYSRSAKWHVSGLAGSYGPQVLRVYRMTLEMGPPDLVEVPSPEGDPSWRAEWEYFRGMIDAGDPTARLDGGLDDARYAHQIVQDIYISTGYRTEDGVPTSRARTTP